MKTQDVRTEPFVAAAAFVGMAGLIWMGPLMVDQFVLFADQEQTRRAAESRALMLPAAALTLLAAAILLAHGRAWHAALVAASVIAPAVAWLAPDTLYQLVAFVLLAPLAAGALLSTILPLPHDVSLLVRLVAVGTVLAFGMVASPFVAMMTLLGAAAWWRFSIVGAEPASALD